MAKEKPIIFSEDEMPSEYVRHDVDLSYLFDGDKELRSIKVIRDNIEFWLANHHAKGRYFTNNPRDPKILNTAHNPPRPRGNIAWRTGVGGNPNGKPKGTSNKISVKQACEKMGANPADFLAALVKGDSNALKQHKIKNPKDLTIAQRMKAAEILLNKLVPNLKPAELGGDGEAQVSEQAQDRQIKDQMVVYLPGKKEGIAIEASEEEMEAIKAAGSTETYMRHHEQETTHYDQSNEDDTYVWTVQDGE